MSMMQRRKGKTWERAVATMLRPLFGDSVKRGFQSRSGRDGCDVEGSPFWVECKHGRLVNLRAALAQAIRDTDGRIPIVIAKDDRTDPVVLMRLADFIAELERALPKRVVDALVEHEEVEDAAESD